MKTRDSTMETLNISCSISKRLDNIDNFQDIEAEFKEEDLNSNK